MSDRDAFLAAIRAHPDEDTPRLAFADWLDEQGTNPDQFRADFVRTACQFARAEPWSADGIVLAERHAALSRKIPAAWTAHLKGRAIASGFERGFVGHVSVYSKRFAAEGGRFFDDPIRSVKFAKLSSAHGSVPPAVLFACPHLARVAKLSLDGSGLTDKELTALAESPHAAGLRAVSLGGINPFPPASLPKLLAARPGISDLGVNTNTDIKDAHAKALAESPALANLSRLDLAGTGVTSAGVAALCGSPFAGNLKALFLAPLYEFNVEHGHLSGSRGLRTDGLALAQALADGTGLRGLEELEVTGRKIGNAGLAALAESRGLPNLRRLTVAENGVTKKGLEILANTPLGRQLRYLNVMDSGALFQHDTAVREMFPRAVVRVIYGAELA